MSYHPFHGVSSNDGLPPMAARGRLLVGDRPNRRIHVCDQDGRLPRSVDAVRIVQRHFVAPGDTLYVVDDNDKMAL